MYHPSTSVRVENLSKTFVMHLRDGLKIPAIRNLSFEADAGECAVLAGPSGAGKSSVLKMIYGSYRADSGTIIIDNGREAADVVQSTPRQILSLRNRAIGYVSQFLRVIPRVSTLDIVRAACLDSSSSQESAATHAAELLTRLNIPEHLWGVPPQTFSGGEQQRINIARGFGAKRPILLLDEPTASLDNENMATVVDMIHEKKRAGVTIIGIFHDAQVRAAVADKSIAIAPVNPAFKETVDELSA